MNKLWIAAAIALWQGSALAQPHEHYEPQPSDEVIQEQIWLQEPPEGMTRDLLEVFKGHPLLTHLSEYDLQHVVIGKIASKTGNLVMIQFIEPKAISVEGKEISSLTVQNPPHWDFNPGDTVVVGFKDNQWNFVGDGHCRLKWLLEVKPPVAVELPPAPPVVDVVPPEISIPGLW